MNLKLSPSLSTDRNSFDGFIQQENPEFKLGRSDYETRVNRVLSEYNQMISLLPENCWTYLVAGPEVALRENTGNAEVVRSSRSLLSTICSCKYIPSGYRSCCYRLLIDLEREFSDILSNGGF